LPVVDLPLPVIPAKTITFLDMIYFRRSVFFSSKKFSFKIR